jgi:hypothetical protein
MSLVNQDQFRFHPGRCFDCWDSTIVVTPYGPGKCITCLEQGNVLPAAQKLSEVVWRRIERQQLVDQRALNAARAIVTATSELPISGPTLQGLLRESDRGVKSCVEILRGEWVLPIGSTRKVGYYWMYTAKDFLDWSRPYRSQSITSLATLHKMQRANFPELAGQESIQFIEQVTDELTEAIR